MAKTYGQSRQNGKGCCFDADESEEEVWTVQPRSRNPIPAKKTQRPLILQEDSTISFTVNGKAISVNVAELTLNSTLVTYLRDRLHLTGTKISCYQGGCGVCIVTASVPTKDGRKVISVNACLTPLLSCDGWDITTVEGLGNRKDGLHPIQSTLASLHGTQCGFCSPGMVMQMNSLLEGKPSATMSEIEQSIDGNICRCTGYRPILDAFKTFASDAPKELKEKVADIEDLANKKKNCCKKNGGSCKSGVAGGLSCKRPTKHLVPSGQGEWFAPSNIDDLLAVLEQMEEGKTARFVGGNTGRGVYGFASADVYIDVKKVPELAEYSVSPVLQVGGAVTMNGLIDILRSVGQSQGEAYSYASPIANHLLKVANTGVRNTGTIAGNLMLKHLHPEFPSDLYVPFEAVNAKVVIRSTTEDIVVSPREFLAMDMTKKLIWKFEFPAVTAEHKFAVYKIAHRSDNAHAYVNAAFLAKVDAAFTVLEKPNLVYGGISGTFDHATNTEEFLVGKSLNDQAVIQEAIGVLAAEVEPEFDYILSSVEYRKHLAQALFYKFVLHVLGDAADPKLQSGATQISRGISSGVQTYETDASLYPVNEPIPKIEGQSQCSGEAEYINDIPSFPGELSAYYVMATVGNCDLDTVDASAALAIPGVLGFFDQSTVPGMNHAVPYEKPEPIFCSGHVEYAGQAIGIIVAESAGLARAGAAAVKVTYKNQQKPVLTVREGIQERKRMTRQIKMPSRPKNLPKDVVEITGEFEIGSQYHFHLETQSVVVRPVEDFHFEIYSATQWMDSVQIVVARALNVPEGSIEVKVRRLGGAYGGKISPPASFAAAAAIAAQKLNRPVRLILDFHSNMELVGKRHLYLVKYQAGATTEGKLTYASLNFYAGAGYVDNESEILETIRFAKNCYTTETWTIDGTNVILNLPSNKACRAPGSTQAVSSMEIVMEHMATAIGMDPEQFRLLNMSETSQGVPNPLPDAIIPQLIASSNFEERKAKVQEFNANNKWKKRGICLQPALYAYECHLPGVTYYFSISIYSQDGSIAISHGGHEMGQGINTKVVQTVAKQLNVPMSLIHQKPANTLMSPNSIVSGGSATTDFICSAAIAACTALNERMQVIAETMDNPTWQELVLECYEQGVDLTERQMGFASRDAPENYDIWGAVVTEVEIDVLTGEKNIVRSDLIEDVGASVNPAVDVGQVEGAFVMSLGLFLTEELKYNPETGMLLTQDTWEYKPPGGHDIPEDFRVTFFKREGSPAGVYGAKATGEPASLFGISSLIAVRRAIAAAKADLGEDPTAWFNLFAPATAENIQLTSGVKSDHFTL